jgi:hypothetical protein
VTAGQGDLEPAARLQLAANLGEVRDPLAGRRDRLDRRSAAIAAGRARYLGTKVDSRRDASRAPRRATADELDRVAERGHADRLDPVGKARLRKRGRRHANPPDAAPDEGRDHRQEARHGPDLAAERQLADQCDPARRSADLLRPEQDSDRDREVERGAGLSLFGRGEVDRDSPRRVDEARVPDRPADPFAGFLERRVREADDREAGQAAGHVHLDADDPTVESDERRREEGRQHQPNLPAGALPALTRRLAASCRTPFASARVRWT